MAPRRDYGERFTDVVKNQVDYQWRRRVRAILPHWLYPLIPGEKGDIGTNLIREVDRRFLSKAFAGAFGCAGVAVTGFVAVFGGVAAMIWKAIGK